ncbi:MAG TPA: aminotransferase class I/II-fold pyridoxal phosphate-dependent enzyme, partial [Bdellovibrionota bacterium]|nr:aminotransferase class I/II-fold pyridoxal phosphate-dependent enzyme [Bdellovibrionota bacterium]
VILTDGVFSMTGEIVELPPVVKLAEKYNAKVFVDDAHAIGVIGERGRGTGEYWDINEKVDLVMGTFSKSFASLGGFIAGPEDVITYIKCHARPFIFSASMPPPSVAATLAALEIMETDTSLLEKLWKNARKMNEGLSSLGFQVGKTKTPVVPVTIGDDVTTFRFVNRLYEEGVFANAVVAPAVPEGCSSVRTSYMATHTDELLDRVLEIFKKLGSEFHLI